jgi:hypothetical protein
VKILFDATAHDQLVSTDYVTFLHYAVYQGNCFAVELFLKSGIDLDKIDVNNAEYPLYFAVENQHLRSDLLLNMTKFIRDCKKKISSRRNVIDKLLEKYFSKGHRSVCAKMVSLDELVGGHLDKLQKLHEPWKSNYWNSFDTVLRKFSEDKYEYYVLDFYQNQSHLLAK